MNLLRSSALAWLLVGLPALAVAAPKEAPRSGQWRGTIQQVDLPAKRLTVQTSLGTTNLVFNNASRVFREKEKIGFDRLQTGDRIVFSWYRAADGQLTINRIKFALPPEESDQP